MASTEGARAAGVDAVEVVGAILEGLLAVDRPARLKDLETCTGIPSAKLHRYLVSMARCGLVAREESRYNFGLLSYRIGQVAEQGDRALALLEPWLQDFAGKLDKPELGQALGLGKWVGRGATIVRWFETHSAFSIRMRPGSTLSITASATAKLLAAYEPREATEPLVRQELEEQGSLSKAAVDAVYAEYASIRKKGIANSYGARRRGLNALSVPLFDQAGAVVAAVTVLGMGPQYEATPDSAGGRLLRKLGQDLSARLGHDPASASAPG